MHRKKASPKYLAAYTMLKVLELHRRFERGELYIRTENGRVLPLSEETAPLSKNGRLYGPDGCKLCDPMDPINLSESTIADLTGGTARAALGGFFETFNYLGVTPGGVAGLFEPQPEQQQPLALGDGKEDVIDVKFSEVDPGTQNGEQGRKGRTKKSARDHAVNPPGGKGSPRRSK